MLIHIHPENPQERLLRRVVDILQDGGVIIYPTDTSYGIGCDISQRKAVDRVYELKQADRKKPMSIICHDFTNLSLYAASVSTSAFRTMRRLLPGPYTFVLNASHEVPRMLLTRQRTVGIRIPDHPICLELVRMLGRPLLSTSVATADEEAVMDPDELHEIWGKRVDAVVGGGPVVPAVSSVVDLTTPFPRVLRIGKGDVSLFLD